MANYFVSSARGSDATGTGTATNPWATIGKAIAGTPAITPSGSGTDKLFVEPGVYYESLTLALTPSSGNPFEIVGDCDGAGFLAGGYSTPRTGLVEWAAWAGDSSANSAACLQGTTKSYVAVRSIKFFGGSNASSGLNGGCVWITSGTNWTFSDCVMLSHFAAAGPALGVSAGGSGLNLTVDRCDFQPASTFGATAVRLTVAETASEYDLGSTFRNCRFFSGGGGSSVGFWLGRTSATGLGSLGGGLSFRGCHFFGGTFALAAYSGVAIALASPITVEGCLFLWCATALAAGQTGQLVENRNAFHSSTPRTNVSTGANSSTTLRPAVDLGDALATGLPHRPFGEPSPGSPLGGFVASGFPSTDRTGRARPEGFGSTSAAAGAFERHDVGTQDATYADGGSGSCSKLTGPASLERHVLVDAEATTISVKVRWDGNHGDANKPQALLLAEPELGVAAQTLTASSTGGTGSTPNAYETLTFAPFTPTKAGAVRLRLVSRPASGGGAAYFDTLVIS